MTSMRFVKPLMKILIILQIFMASSVKAQDLNLNMKQGHLLSQKEIEAISFYKIECDLAKKEKDMYAQKLFEIDEAKHETSQMDLALYAVFFITGLAVGLNGR